MGVDLKGHCTHNPGANYKGKDLCMPWWQWRPIAVYCFAVAPIICEASHHFAKWQSNDGHMTAGEAVDLGQFLQLEIDAGRTKRYVQEYHRALENLPDVKCTPCNGTGKRPPGLTWRLPDAPAPPVTIECNGCFGYGTSRPDACNYPLRVGSIQQFARFAVHSGGFEVR